ncbi:MAG: sulfatase-like hydrolase/transferase [Methanosarcinales archaeon]|nr:sulfatase-like hydrolase/transferase [Methanosarcinales archaeon]
MRVIVGKHLEYLIVLLLCISFFTSLAAAQTSIKVSETNPPRNVVLLIVDGMGSGYVSHGMVPAALDGSLIIPPDVPFMDSLAAKGVLLPYITVPDPRTGPAHSVIVSGYSGAEPEMVAYADATIYDVLEDEDFISIAIMHKGDASGVRGEQDVILYSEDNSIPEPDLKVQVNGDAVPAGIIDELEYWEQQLPVYLEGTTGIDSYIAYSDWELDAAADMVSLMSGQYPDTKYILTMNVGVVDSAGHYRGVEGYVDAIEGVDRRLEPLYTAVTESGTALVITADHGMAFKTSDAARGGHASEDYGSPEALTVPLFIVSSNIVPGVVSDIHGQEDVAPTILSILDVPGRPKYGDGEAILVKDYANLWVSSDNDAGIEVLQGSKTIASSSGGNSYFFTGLKPKINYTVRISNGDGLLEQVVRLDVDRAISFGASTDEVDGTRWDGWNWRKVIASILILLVISGGMMVIYRLEH